MVSRRSVQQIGNIHISGVDDRVGLCTQEITGFCICHHALLCLWDLFLFPVPASLANFGHIHLQNSYNKHFGVRHGLRLRLDTFHVCFELFGCNTDHRMHSFELASTEVQGRY